VSNDNIGSMVALSESIKPQSVAPVVVVVVVDSAVAVEAVEGSS